VTRHIDDIWKGVVKSDPEAWRSLVERFAGLVYTVAARVGLSDGDAEDCAQQTWLSLYRHRASIRDPQTLPAWLIKTTRRQAVRMLKRLTRESAMAPEIDPELNRPLPDEEVLALERQAILDAALEQLDPRCRTVLTALFLSPDNKSYGDIARSLGLATNTLGPLRSRCLKKLQAILEKMGYALD
jgi:RNA polymerase sigma factor (sigma-70 family)